MSEFEQKVLRTTAKQMATGIGKGLVGWGARPCKAAEIEPLPLQSKPHSVPHAQGPTLFLTPRA